VELLIGNTQQRLKPGMFIRATAELMHVPDATIVPVDAITRRGDQPGVFVVDDSGNAVGWKTVTVGIREGARVQVEGLEAGGRVVTLGQQLIDEGSPITIHASEPAASARTESEP